MMDETLDVPTETFFTPISQSGPLELLIILLMAAIGIHHFSLSIRIVLGRRAPVAAGLHVILLFAAPCLLFLSVAAMLPTLIPGLFIKGIDADQGLIWILRWTSSLGWICLGIFAVNLLMCLPAIGRHQWTQTGKAPLPEKK